MHYAEVCIKHTVIKHKLPANGLSIITDLYKGYFRYYSWNTQCVISWKIDKIKTIKRRLQINV